MTIPVVWTERPLYTGCVSAAGLMAAIYGGHTAFPLGIYSAPELAELERLVGVPQGFPARPLPLPPRLGLDGALLARYGRRIRPLDVGLATALRRPGYALALGGTNARYPAGSPLRRWDPAFIGSHAVTVLTLGMDQLRYLDPEAPPGFAGDLVPVATVEAWCYGGPDDARLVRADEYLEADVSYTATVRPYPALRPIYVRAGSTIQGWHQASPGAPVKVATWPAASMAYADAEVDVTQAPDAAQTPHGTFLRAALDPRYGGYYAGLLIVTGQVDPGPVPVDNTRQTAIAALRAAATALTDEARKLGGT